ncbi:MAG: slipin family protein [Chloroflexi bacterium]|nr:slipin family protein [Chloroflexota bacterium]
MEVGTIGLLIIALLIIVTILSSLRICSEWERKVVLRLGRFGGVRGPGIFFLLPYVEQTPFTIDTRVVTSPFQAEQTLTKDGASVTVDAIMYWRVVDAGRAAIQVANYSQAVMGAAAGGLRDIIGRNDLSTVLSQRRELDEQLTVTLDEQTEPWGIKVQSVQLRDIKVPDNLQDALSRMAQAERERQARVILGESEIQVAQQFAQAGELYREHPTALHLRGMNMLYETMRSGVASVIVVPSSALETMNLGMIGGISSLASQNESKPDGRPQPQMPVPSPSTQPTVQMPRPTFPTQPPTLPPSP